MSFALLQVGPVTLYAQVASILRDRILSGVWKHKEEVPTLDELARQFSVARVTVRQAIQMLSAEGLLSSQRGRRTYVSFEARSNDDTPLYSSTGSIDIATHNYTIDIISKERIAGLPPRLIAAGKAGNDYWRIRKIDRDGGTAYSLSDNYILPSVYRRFPRDAEKRTKISRLVRDHTLQPIKRAYEVIRVGMLDYEEAMLLQAPLSHPVARVSRIFLGPSEEIVYFGSFAYRSERFAVERDITEYLTK